MLADDDSPTDGGAAKGESMKPKEKLVSGPLVTQSESCARMARILMVAAEELWDAAVLNDPAQMWEEARAAASRVLAACSMD
jgi:hypothetical protein